MIKEIGSNKFELRDTVKVRQAQALMQLGRRHEEKEIDEIDMAIGTVSGLLLSINGDTDSSKFVDWLMDNLEVSEMTELAEAAMEIVNSFVKKNENLNTSTLPS